MADEIKDTEVVDGNQTEATEVDAKYTQQDIDRIVGERLAREKAKSDKAVAEAKAESERKQLEEQSEFKTLYEKSQLELEDIRNQAQAERLNTKKQSLLLEAGYPADKLADLLDFVTGDDEEAVKASVEKLARVAPPKAAPIDPAVSGGNRQQATQESLKEKGRKRFEELRAKGLL
jgi:hypothetical protein